MGIAKGICGFGAWSRDAAGACDSPLSPKKGLFDADGETTDEEDGKTSVNLDGGSFLSGFQIPVDQGNDPEPVWPRFRVAEEVPHTAAPESAEGVVG